MIIFCDVDNCIADDLWRQPLICWHLPQGHARYHLYHTASVLDRGGWDNISRLREHIIRGAQVYFLTAMPERYAPIRKAWLRKIGLRWTRILFRPNDCVEDSVRLKRRMVRQLRAEGVPFYEVAAAYDDRRAVVEMFREEGLPGIHMEISPQEHLHRVI